jgi:hypothetical protein
MSHEIAAVFEGAADAVVVAADEKDLEPSAAVAAAVIAVAAKRAAYVAAFLD